jgi:NAD(P)H-nitrite reductase large subunit
LRKENERLTACEYCKPALDYLLVLLSACEIENFSTHFQEELFNALKWKYNKGHYLETVCEKVTRAYGRTVSPENFLATDFEVVTGVKLSTTTMK